MFISAALSAVLGSSVTTWFNYILHQLSSTKTQAGLLCTSESRMLILNPLIYDKCGRAFSPIKNETMNQSNPDTEMHFFSILFDLFMCSTQVEPCWVFRICLAQLDLFH